MSFDMRGAALVSFAALAAAAGARWYLASQVKARMLKSATAAPSVSKEKLVKVLGELERPSESAVGVLTQRAQAAGGDHEREHIMKTAGDVLGEALEEDQRRVLKAEGVTLDEVTSAYRYYATKEDKEVLAAAEPIKRRLGMYMLNKDTCLTVLQAISDIQCEHMNSVVKQAAAKVKPSQATMELFMNTVRQELAKLAESAAVREMGVSTQQLMMRVQGYCQKDPAFQKSVQATMAPVDACSQQALSSLAMQ